MSRFNIDGFEAMLIFSLNNRFDLEYCQYIWLLFHNHKKLHTKCEEI